MKILHVTLGNPKNHQGGLNEYCNELMKTENSLGYDTVLLIPGKTTIFKKTRIRQISKLEYAIDNPLPVAITYGIDLPSRYMLRTDESIYDKWLEKVQPDVIHIHSIQGIHKEFFKAASEKKIPIIFTTHDYYPICCKCNFVTFENKQCDGPNAKKCATCNFNTGLSSYKQMVIQSKIYQKCKNTRIISTIKKDYILHREDQDVSQKLRIPNAEDIDAFDKLINYYRNIMSFMTIIHANSIATCKIYRTYFTESKCEVIPITHSNINKSIHIRKDKQIIHFGYFGGMNKLKGYDQIISVCKLLADIPGWNIELYGGLYSSYIKGEHINTHGYFSQENAKDAWASIDVLIVPSQCRETFGFAVLESLSYGVPVICSDLVGSKYLIESIDKNDIYPYSNTEILASRMKQYLNKKFYDEQVKKLENIKLPANMREHAKRMVSLYKKAEKYAKE
jgi:glycosyltransferase involved in cell wall biosynthesis